MLIISVLAMRLLLLIISYVIQPLKIYPQKLYILRVKYTVSERSLLDLNSGNQ